MVDFPLRSVDKEVYQLQADNNNNNGTRWSALLTQP